MKRARRKGFTLVEIMIVVAIIALLAAIAIPNLLRARHNANESAAIASCRTISTAMESWRAARTPATYQGATLATMSTATPAYIDTVLGGATKQGYIYALAVDAARGNQEYLCTGTPQVYRTTGTRSFSVDETGVVRGADNGGAALAKGAGAVIE